jgi:chromosome segregation ATPase
MGYRAMKINKNTLLKIIYEPKKVLMSRTVVSCVLVSFLAGGLIYVKHNGTKSQQEEAASQDGNDATNPSIAAMQSHIASLNSRIKHLSIDNKRLSTTGHKLSEQLRNTSSSIKEQLARTKELQLELYTLDQHLISKYDNFVELQKIFSEAKMECEKEKGKDRDKSKKCMHYVQIRQNIEDLISQIKFLKAKREVLLSEFDRAVI